MNIIKMKNINKKQTLADKIANILVTAPATLDPEDQDDNTTAKLNEPLEENYESEEELLSKFRKQNLDLLADVDVRYAGKGGSRKDVFSSDEDETIENEELDDNADESRSETEDTSRENTESEYSEDEHEDASYQSFDDNEICKEEIADDFKHIKKTDVSAHVKKGQSVRNQLCLWENLLEMRIQVQKCILAANKMPQSENYQVIKSDSGAEYRNKITETKSSVSNLLEKLLLLQKLVLQRYPETKNLENKKDKVQASDSDEEIASDTENESFDESVDKEREESPCKKRKLQEFEEEINRRHNNYKTYRNTVIQKWHDKTRLILTKNNNNSHSIISHIEQVLADRNKLVRRTQLKKSDFKIIGEECNSDEIINNDQELKPVEEYNTNIFDDDDFYHQLLRELIEVKSADLTDPVQLSRQWMRLQNLRSKMKRKIDTRATKGRKIRYAIHKKLVNYMAPIEGNSWTDEAKTELFSSLFGKNQSSSTML